MYDDSKYGSRALGCDPPVVAAFENEGRLVLRDERVSFTPGAASLEEVSSLVVDAP